MSGRLSDSGSYSITYNLPFWFLKQTSEYTSEMKISRKNFYEWKDRFESSGREFPSLEVKSKAPKTERTIELTSHNFDNLMDLTKFDKKGNIYI
ncbi:MAG: hypothetical protein HYW86_03315 [Candidatus Roizmanbacteria bacterium]|nr:MAG: hypothetical protein HYW86_03315 [Candidatus Roizmanbacteria bacterium]